MSFSKSLDRLRVSVADDGLKMHEYGHGCYVECLGGWNDSCPMIRLTMSVDEMRDLRYLLSAAISKADEKIHAK